MLAAPKLCNTNLTGLLSDDDNTGSRYGRRCVLIDGNELSFRIKYLESNRKRCSIGKNIGINWNHRQSKIKSNKYSFFVMERRRHQINGPNS